MDELDADAPPGMTFDVATEPGSATVAISGELDMDSVEELERGVSAALKPVPSRLVLDLRELRFADSSAIALWVRWASMVDKLELRNPSALLRRVITTMGLSEILGLP